HVEERLEGPRELRHAESPKRAAARRVGVDGARLEPDVRHAIRASRRVRALLNDPWPDVRVGAYVVVSGALDRDERAIAPEADAHVDARGAAAHRLERFRDRSRQAHRPTGRAREGGRQGLELRVGLAAEATAEMGDHDANSRERPVEPLREHHAYG